MKRILVPIGMALVVSVLSFFLAQGQSLPTGGRLDAIYFQNELHGFIRVCCADANNEVYETLDGGKSWDRTNAPVKGLRRGRVFANPVIGWSVVEDQWPHSSIYGTQDGGRSWKLLVHAAKEGNFYFDAIQAVSESEVWALGWVSYHSADGGKTWEEVKVGYISVDFLDRDHGWINGRQRTRDRGRTWEKLPPPPDPPYSKQDVGGPWDLYFIDRMHGWMVSGDTENNIEGGEQRGVIWYTSDGGDHWSCIAVLNHYLWSVYFLNEKVGWVAGLRGTFLKTTDGGKTWAQP